MFGRKKTDTLQDSGDRILIYKKADCLGAACVNFTGVECSSRLELLEATGKSGGKDLGPLREDCNYALYGQVCTSGKEQIVVKRIVESPNGQADMMELVARSGRTDGQRIVLETPVESIVFSE